MKNFKQFNESKMFDDAGMLAQHSEEYIKNFHIKSSTWTQHFNEILKEDFNYTSMAIKVDELIELVKKDYNLLETFSNEIRSHISELDDIYKVNQTLSESDDVIYDRLEDIKGNIDFSFEKVEEYINELKETSKSYRKLDDQIITLRTFKFIN